ncbi:MAG: hypothetical protein HY435_01655 [Candidatus Liptonbacteria bacterium]|nr:hypothetical protein [Candidatus Liptonbacteria bacterium]
MKFLTSPKVIAVVAVLIVGAALIALFGRTGKPKAEKDPLTAVGTTTLVGGTVLENARERSPAGDPAHFRILHNGEQEVSVVYQSLVEGVSCPNARVEANGISVQSGDSVLALGTVIDNYVVSVCRSSNSYIESLGSKAQCETAGGEWGQFGATKVEQCNYPTRDAGKACRSSDECEGDCFAELTEGEKVRVASGEEIRKTGRCTARTLDIFGCNAHVEGGIVIGILCGE